MLRAEQLLYAPVHLHTNSVLLAKQFLATQLCMCELSTAAAIHDIRMNLSYNCSSPCLTSAKRCCNRAHLHSLVTSSSRALLRTISFGASARLVPSHLLLSCGHDRWHSKANTRPSVAAAAVSTQAADDVITRLYGALNLRDMAAVRSSLAEDVVYENLALQNSIAGKNAVSVFYQQSLGSVPDAATFELEQITGGDTARVGVVWRLVLSGTQTLMSRGLSFYTLNPQGLICAVVECHEHPMKLSDSQLHLVRPLVRSMSGPMLPAVQEVSRTLQEGVDSLLVPLTHLANLVTPPPSLPPTSPPTAAAAGSLAGPSAAISRPYSPVGAGLSSSNSSSAVRRSVVTNAAAGPAAQPAAAAAAAARRSAAPVPSASWGSTAAQRAAAQRGAAAAAGAPAGSAAGGGGSTAGLPTDPPVNVSGLWVKDAARSDTKGYEASLDVLGLSGLQKVTARLIEGIEIQQTPTKFTVNFLTVVPFFRVTEEVPLNAESSQLGRRDLRPGRQTAAACTLPNGGGVLVEMSWGAPLAGSLTELYTLLPDGALCVHAETRVGQRVAQADAIYTRSPGSRDALLSDSQRRNGSFGDVLRRQKEQGLSV